MDSSRLLNASLEAGARRAIDIRKCDSAFMNLVKAAVLLALSRTQLRID